MGLIIGLLAKFIMPGKDPGGLIVTILIGTAGSFVSGFVGSFLGFGAVTGVSYRKYSAGCGRRPSAADIVPGHGDITLRPYLSALHKRLILTVCLAK